MVVDFMTMLMLVRYCKLEPGKDAPVATMDLEI